MKIGLTVVSVVMSSLLSSCAMYGPRETRWADWTQAKEEVVLEFAGIEVAKREPPYWAEGASLELTAHQDNVWIVTAWAPYPLNTLGDFRWLEITGDGKIIRYHNGTKKDLEWLRSIRMKKRVKDYH
jgi:hypothetical protein